MSLCLFVLVAASSQAAETQESKTPYASGAGGTPAAGTEAAVRLDVVEQGPDKEPQEVPLGVPVDPETLERLKLLPELFPSTPRSEAEDPSATEPPSPAPDAPNTPASFQGIGYTGWFPPDNGVAAGPSHVLEAINSSWRVFNKNGSAATGNINLCGSGGWWTPVLPAGVTSCFDPRVAYDQHSGRWILLAVARDTSTQRSWYLLSTSWSSDPLGTWCIWSLDGSVDGSTPSSNWADFPALGVDNQAIYITSNQFAWSDGFSYSKLRILGKSQLYSNTCGAVSWWDFWNMTDINGAKSFTIQPAYTLGTPGAEYLVNSTFGSASSITFWTLTNPLSAPPTFVRSTVSTQAYGLPPNAEQCENATRIHTLDTRLQNAVYRGGRVTTTQTSACPSDTTKACIRLLEIDPSGPTATFDQMYGAWSSGWYYYYPAVMPDQSGNLHIAFNRSRANPDSSAGCVELRQTGKLASETTIQASAGLRAGVDSYVRLDDLGRNRWGDYTGIAPDPTDGAAVWMSGEYSVGGILWSTWIAETSFGVPQPCFTLTRTHSGDGGDPIASPGSSSGCSTGQYHAGEGIDLTASPGASSTIASWTGTDNDASTSVFNTATMPAANHTVSVNYVSSPDVALENGVPRVDSVTGSTPGSSWKYYYVDLGGGVNSLTVDLFALSADADLYVRFNAKPTLSEYACRPFFGGTSAEQCAFNAPAGGRWWIGVNNFDTGTINYTVMATWTNPSADLDFFTVSPCRILDTRSGSPLLSGVARNFPVAGNCGIPASAKAVSFNVTITQPTALGHVTLWPGDLQPPGVSTINFSVGQTRANNAVLRLATDGLGDIAAQATVLAGGSVHLILDVNGYFQ